MNSKSEQLRFDASVIVEYDQPLKKNEMFEILSQWLGETNLSLKKIFNRRVFVYSGNSKEVVLLAKSITYLGNPHPIFKKRIQLPSWYQEFCTLNEKSGMRYDVKFLGIYHYDDNTLFVDFFKETYLEHGLHNSSAHVYINDLYQAMVYGSFRKIDKFGNTLVALRGDKLMSYLNGSNEELSLFDLFRKFNCGFSFGEWLNALDAIREMHDGKWQHWKQTEWAGWFLEYKFDKFTREEGTEQKMRYVGSANKGKMGFDFDVHFEEDDFYGDLKASDIKKKETPGNDQNTLVECIYRYRKFWYIIYEHDTNKDSEENGYEATIARNKYIKSMDPTYDKDVMSYHSRMKHSVRFVRMTIIELNAVNFRDALKTFNQGHQPDGSKRAPKFMINKNVLNNDNYVVFRYEYKE